MKFFYDSPGLLANGGIIAVTSGAVVGDNAIDKLAYTYHRSVGSSDAVTETYTQTFPSSTISRIQLLDHNWKGYNAQYWNGAAWTHFAGVVGLDGALANITETAFADESAYYEFTPVVTTGIRYQVTTTQVANAEKYIASILPTTEIGTLLGFPKVTPTLDPKARTTEMLSGLVSIVKQNKVFSANVSFENYPVRDYGADVTLMLTLIDLEVPFYIWPCGGRRGSTYFSYAMRTWRLRDLFRVQTDSAIAAEWAGNLYKSGQNLGELVFRGHV
jgi:hypothetical protein